MLKSDSIESLLLGILLHQKILIKVLKKTEPKIYNEYLNLLNTKDETTEILNSILNQFLTESQISKIKLPDNFND
ncbi:hypothetical protein [Fusobacterium varium]|uniref:hypothetical protein n=1 Tax=Fusobacterium varium TaxID=856 RepID=UPI00189AFB59|nr:hypothetical protein [Fusobacterium varium]